MRFIRLHTPPTCWTQYRVERKDGTPLGKVIRGNMSRRPWFAYDANGDYILASATRKTAARAVRLRAQRIGI